MGGAAIVIAFQPHWSIARLLPYAFGDSSGRRPASTTADFFRDLVRQHLFATLHTLLHTSLSIEHLRRVRHLEGAIQRVDERLDDLTRRSRALRQEEITEEIEVILLSAEMVGPER